MDERTTGLGVGEYRKMNYPYIIRLSNNEKIDLSRQIFNLGRDKRRNDYSLSEITTVSRMHAKIFERNGKYYIMDLGSTNKTFVNGTPIPPNTEIALIAGAKIRLAKEDFVFNI